MRVWNELSMAEKADIMKLAIEGGVYDLDAIRSGYNEFAKGGKIHIAPSKRGTFTAAASKHGKSVQAFASQVLANKENYSPAMVKKANFARNASKWKHAEGGNLYGGTNENSQQMQIGLKVTNDWKPYTLGQILDNADKIQQRQNVAESIITTGGAGYFPSMSDATREKVDKVGNLTQAGVKAVGRYAWDKATSKPDAERNAGSTFLRNLNPENQLEVLDAAMHSTRGAEVMSSIDLVEHGLPNYLKLIQGKPMDINYTGNQLYMDVLYPENQVNTKRDLVNLYLKGDENGFEDVTEDAFYQNGADYKKYINQYYPGKKVKTYKMSSDGQPIYLDNKEIEDIRKNKLNKQDYINEGWTKGGDNVGSMIRWYKDIDGQLYAFDSDIWDFNPKDWSWEGDDNKLVDKVGTPFILKAARPIRSNDDKYYDTFGKGTKAYGGTLYPGGGFMGLMPAMPGIIAVKEGKDILSKAYHGIKQFIGLEDTDEELRQKRNTNRYAANGYIGGEPRDTRQKYFDVDKEFTDSVNSISKRYGLNPSVVASRIAEEGPVDQAIIEYNDENSTGTRGQILSDNGRGTHGPLWGLDDFYTRVQNNDVTVTTTAPYKYKKKRFINEKGRETESITSPQWWFGIEATASEMKARRDKLKKNNPWMNNHQLDAATAMSFNYGETGVQNHINSKKPIPKRYNPYIKTK